MFPVEQVQIDARIIVRYCPAPYLQSTGTNSGSLFHSTVLVPMTSHYLWEFCTALYSICKVLQVYRRYYQVLLGWDRSWGINSANSPQHKLSHPTSDAWSHLRPHRPWPWLQNCKVSIMTQHGIRTKKLFCENGYMNYVIQVQNNQNLSWLTRLSFQYEAKWVISISIWSNVGIFQDFLVGDGNCLSIISVTSRSSCESFFAAANLTANSLVIMDSRTDNSLWNTM